MSEAIDPTAHVVGGKATAHEMMASGFKVLIRSHLSRVDSFLIFTSSESNFESFGPPKMVVMFLLNTADCLDRPFANTSPLLV